MDLLTYFGLSERPFVLAPLSSHYVAPDPDPAQVLLDVIRQRRGLAVCTGVRGSGKSILARAVLSQLPTDTSVAMLLVPVRTQPDPDRLVMRVASGLGVSNIENPGQALDALIAAMHDAALQQKQIAVLIDDAHILLSDPGCYSQVRGFLNLDDPHRGGHLLNILLFGDILLNDPSLNSRVAERVVLAPWRMSETRRFIETRLKNTHARDGMFNPDVIHMIHDFSGGIPSEVVRYADALMRLMFERKAGVANLAMLDDVMV